MVWMLTAATLEHLKCPLKETIEPEFNFEVRRCLNMMHGCQYRTIRIQEEGEQITLIWNKTN